MSFGRRVHIKTDEEVELLRESSLLVGKTLELDAVAEEFIRDHGAEPGFKGYGGFPNSLCTSVNEAVVHGIPNDKPLVDGDIVSVDCGVLKNEFYGDSAYTFAVGEIAPEIQQLLEVTKECLQKAIEQAVVGKRIGDIGFACQQHAEQSGYGVVRELVGHGLGRSLHEAPEVPNYGKRGNGPRLMDGMVLAIEPMINLGRKEVFHEEDGWTIVTADRKVSAHFEHDIVVRKDRADVLSSFDEIEKVLQQQKRKV
jgi:methionyl aminopeptidase